MSFGPLDLTAGPRRLSSLAAGGSSGDLAPVKVWAASDRRAEKLSIAFTGEEVLLQWKTRGKLTCSALLAAIDEIYFLA